MIAPSRGRLADAEWYRDDRIWVRAGLAGDKADPFSSTPFWQLPLHELRAPFLPVLLREDGDSAIAFRVQDRLFPRGIGLAPLDSSWRFASPVLGRHGFALLEETVSVLSDPVTGAGLNDFEISGLVPHGSLKAKLFERYPDTFTFKRIARSVLCGAGLSGGLDGFLSRRSANHRKKLRSSERRASHAGVTFERARPRDGGAAGRVRAATVFAVAFPKCFTAPSLND